MGPHPSALAEAEGEARAGRWIESGSWIWSHQLWPRIALATWFENDASKKQCIGRNNVTDAPPENCDAARFGVHRLSPRRVEKPTAAQGTLALRPPGPRSLPSGKVCFALREVPVRLHPSDLAGGARAGSRGRAVPPEGAEPEPCSYRKGRGEGPRPAVFPEVAGVSVRLPSLGAG